MESRNANNTSEEPEKTELPPDFFLSYAADDKPWAVWIASQLEHAGYHVFVHAWDLRPGHNIILTINKALLYHPRVLLIVSPNLPQENLPQIEWAAALFQDLTGEKQALVPVRVTRCQVGGLLAPLQSLDLFDLSEQEALDKLLAGLSAERARSAEPLPGAGSLAGLFFPGNPRRIFQARDVPKDYVPRPVLLKDLKRLLLSQEDQHPAAITTALRGAGGFGKTTLASAICHDEDIQEAFPDGILWVELGEKRPRPLDVLNELLHVLDPEARETLTLEGARQRWQHALEERSSLLVIDDVWHTESLDELLQGGPRCRRLVTTRNDRLLPQNARRVWVDAMEPAEAMALLCEGVIDDWQHTLDPSVLEQVVVQQLGCWPLLVSLARGMLKNQVGRLGKTPQQALNRLQHAYEERGMATFHLGDRDERQRNVDASLEVNLRQLEEWVPAHYQARQRYLELVVFPEDTDIALSTLQIYWKGTGGLNEDEMEELCLLLSDLSLLLPKDTERPTIRLHDVLRSYLIQRVGSQSSTLHQRLLDAHHQHYVLTRWADLPRSEAYLWQRLIYHLCQAGHQEAIQVTLTDLLFVTRKVVYVGVSALEADLTLAIASLPHGGQEHSLQLFSPLLQMIRQSSHLLSAVVSEAEVGGLLLSQLHDEAGWGRPRLALEQELPRPWVAEWHALPHRSSSALIRTLRGHTYIVTSCTVSPDGRWIVSASSDDTLKVWNSTTGAEVRTLRGHTSSVEACTFSPDGRWIVSASRDGTLKVWNSATGAEVRALRGHMGSVNGCAFSPDGRWIVSASSDDTLKVWNSTTGAEVCTLRGHTSSIEACTFSPDGRWIVSASSDDTLKVWDSTTGAEVRTLRGHTSSVKACTFSPDGKWIVSTSYDHMLKVWEAAIGAEVRTLSGHINLVRACGYSPDGRWIVSASSDNTLKVWGSTTGAEVRTLRGHTSSVKACTFSPDGKWIASACDDRTLKVWDSATGAEVRTLRGHLDLVNGCGYSPDGKWIVSASSDQTLKVWNSTTGAEVRTLRGHLNLVNGCGYSPDGKWIVSASSDQTLKVWDSTTEAKVRTLGGHTGSVRACGYSPDGRWIVSASSDDTLKVWNSITGAEHLTLRGHISPVRACAFSPDGRWIASASGDSTLKVWETQGGQCVLTFPVDGQLYGCAFHPDGEHLVACGERGMYFLRLVQ